jgi:alpha-L-arabinofuranosidase
MKNKILPISLLSVLLSFQLGAQDANIIVNVDSLKAKVSPNLHGVFFEEISHGGEGGLYAELIQNRGFEDFRLPQGCTLDSGWLTCEPISVPGGIK